VYSLASTTTVAVPSGTAQGTVIVTTPLPTFSCDAAAYIISGQTLYKENVQLGNYTTVKSGIGNANIDAMGYSVSENFLYGASGAIPSNLIRIGANGDSVFLTSLNLTKAVTIGDLDENTQYWASAGGTYWIQVDMRPGSGTYGRQVASGTTSLPGILGYSQGLLVNDWAYVPNGGNFLYSLANDIAQSNTFLLSFDRAAHTWAVVANYNSVAGTALFLNQNSWGAVFSAKDGILYGEENTTGQIWKFPINGTKPTMVSTGLMSSNNDGARCFNAPGY
jgi:hypothetical protein